LEEDVATAELAKRHIGEMLRSLPHSDLANGQEVSMRHFPRILGGMHPPVKLTTAKQDDIHD
jgi:hypothetical protein